MKRRAQACVVALVLRVLHAALVVLKRRDTRAVREFSRLPEGAAYSVVAAAGGPQLHVQWSGGRLIRLREPAAGACELRIKSMRDAYLMFTGQMGLAQAYARHAFTLRGDIADVMRLARLVNLVESYLFPRLMTRRIMTDVPPRECSPLRVYAALAVGGLLRRF